MMKKTLLIVLGLMFVSTGGEAFWKKPTEDAEAVAFVASVSREVLEKRLKDWRNSPENREDTELKEILSNIRQEDEVREDYNQQNTRVSRGWKWFGIPSGLLNVLGFAGLCYIGYQSKLLDAFTGEVDTLQQTNSNLTGALAHCQQNATICDEALRQHMWECQINLPGLHGQSLTELISEEACSRLQRAFHSLQNKLIETFQGWSQKNQDFSICQEELGVVNSSKVQCESELNYLRSMPPVC